jgi:CubicO group peptidase (beta-lactamase class C family)
LIAKYCLSLGVMVLLASSGWSAQLTPERLQFATTELEKLTEKEMQVTGIPGIAIAVVFNDEVIFAKGFGVREVGQANPVDADTVFQVASMSKPIGSTVVAALVGEGLLSWDSRISDLDPGFEMNDAWVTREITVRDLYCHRSGLPDHAGDLLEDLGFTREEILHRLRYQKPDTSFRSGYAYTNFGLTEGAIAAAKAARMPWEEVSEEKLYKPLGMTSTSSRYQDFIARQNRALGHVRIDGKWVQKYHRDPDAQSPAGGVSSSVNDMAKWMRLQLAKGKFGGAEIVKEEPLAETHHPQILMGFSPLNGLPGFYGLGWNVSYDEQGRLRLSHSGAFDLGSATNVVLVPAEGLGIVVLTNAFPLGVAEGLASTFLDYALYGKSTQDWLAIYKQAFVQILQAETAQIGNYTKRPSSPAPPAANAAYLGTYKNDFFGAIAIIEKEGALAIALGPRKMTFPMTHWDRDTFTYETAGEMAVGTAGITFTIGPDGKAQRILVENLNIHGNGLFERVSNGGELVGLRDRGRSFVAGTSLRVNLWHGQATVHRARIAR